MEPNAATAMPKLPSFNGKKFSSPSFAEWQMRVIAQVREKGNQEALLPIAEGLNAARTLAYQKADNSVYNTIISNLSGEALLFASQRFPIRDDTPVDAHLGFNLYQALKAKFSGRLTEQEIFMLEMKILTAKCEKNVLNFLQFIQTHRFSYISKTTATEAQTLLLDKKIVQVILNGLPKSYQTFVSIQRGLEEPPTLEALISAVEIEDRTQDSSLADLSANFASATFHRGRGGRSRARGARGANRGNRGSDRGSSRTANSSISSTLNNGLYFSQFILDSGATQHSTYDSEDIILESLKPCMETILTADNSKMICSKKGTVKIDLDNSGSFLTLNEVRLIPSSEIKLISLEYLLKENYTITSKSHEKLVLSRNDSSDLIFQIPPSGPRLYYLVLTSQNRTLTTTREKKKPLSRDEFAYHHFNMCHLNNQDLATSLRKHGYVISNETMKNFVCEHCLLSKSTAISPILPNSTIASKDTKNPGDWIHSDLNGPETSYNTTKYAMNFVDEISGLIVIELLDHKGQVPNALLRFIQKCRTTTLRLEIGPNTTFHSDGDQVYKSNNISTICATERMFQSFSPAYHANWNGSAERLWRTLHSDARAMISSASQIQDTIIDDSYWPLAIQHAALLRNLIPTGNRKISAYETITGKSPGRLLSTLKPFGSPCFVHNSSPTVKKMDAKAFKGYYVGYDIESNSHKVLNPITKMVTTTVNAKFDITPFNTTLLKSSIRLTRPKIVRSYKKKENTSEKTQLPATSEIKQLTDLNEVKSTLSSPLDNSKINNTENSTITEPSAQILHPQIENSEAATQSSSSTPEPSVTAPLQRPNTRSQMRVTSAFTEEQRLQEFSEDSIPTITPKSAKSALSGEFSNQWKESMLREIQSLFDNNVFETATDIPPDANILPSMFTFRIKDDPGIEYVKRFKARLVALGNFQIPGVHYNEKELSSPVLKASSFRALTAKAVYEGWTTTHVDVNSAFCNTPLKEVIYMKFPSELTDLGYPSVIRLKKNLYGLHQANHGWNDLVTTWCVKEYGCQQFISDPCLFSHPKFPIVFGLFVDDFKIAGTPEAKAAFTKALGKRFKISDKGLTLKYIGINVDQSVEGSITLSQHDYIKTILQKAKMEDCHPALTPGIPKTVLCAPVDDADIASVSTFPYGQVVGQLLWISVLTKPEIAYQVGQLAKYISNFGKCHVDAAKHCLRYLKGTMHMGITYRKSPLPATVQIFSDATWANDSEMKSVGGNVFLLLGGAISWRAKTQPCIAVSSCDSEYTACYDTAKESVYMRLLLKELGFPTYQSTEADFNIQTDNQAAISVAYGTTKHEHVKHILIHIQFLRELVKSKQVSLTYVASENNVADALTKNLPKPAFDKFRKSLLGLQ